MVTTTTEDQQPRRSNDDTGVRSVAQLNMLHSLAAKLNALRDVEGIGAAITSELRTIIDYHNCRVYMLADDDATLEPVAFRGELLSEYEHETLDELRCIVGEGITGTVAATRTSLLTPDAREVDVAILIEGTEDDLLESMLAVPMVTGEQLVGVIVLSSLGYGKFDEDDRRLLEVLAPHAAVAIANARLLQTEREAAETSSALLALSQVLTRSHTVGDILQEALETIPTLVPCAVVGAYVADDRTGGYRLARLHQVREGLARARRDIVDVPPEVVAMFTPDGTTPFVISREMIEHLPADLMLTRDASETLIAPLAWEPDGAGALVLTARDTDATFTERDLPLAKGIADITSLALGNARRLSELERFHELVETLDAVFWEAGTTDLGFRFVGGRTRRIAGAEDWPPADSAWGDHIAEPDRPEALTALRAAIQLGEDRSLEYRVARPDGETAWVRDLVHLVRGIQGPRLLRGLMVDVTERKRAEQALRQSERKYSEAFLREREAAQRLRSLDEMKNTFLEAVSHDLRTPLTSILGSALTLEQTGLDLPRADALDLVHRVAANARKLERLLADLLDLDRLQRGIVTPQRRPTALPSVLDRVLDEADPKGHSIDAEADDVTVSVDAGKLERILENLLSNALRHTPPGASVWVRLRADDDGVRIVVEDDGPGIPTELREAVFEPFRQVPGSAAGHSPGVGIGLSLVRRFAELHGGRAWVEDRPGGGASFRVTLPSG